MDVLFDQVPEKPLAIDDEIKPYDAHHAAIKAAAELLREAQRPVFTAG